MSFKIIGTGSFLPPTVLTNQELAKNLDTDSEWISSRLGILERRICHNEENSDLACEASLRAIEKSNISPEEIDCIILATITPDRKVPSTSIILKNKLGIKNNCPTYDIAAACSGFIYALEMAINFFSSSKYKKILIVGSDVMSSMIDWNHRHSVFLGDGAGAIILEATSKNTLFHCSVGSLTSEPFHFTVPKGENFFQMNPGKVYEAGCHILPTVIKKVLNETNLTLDDVKMIIPHQPSLTMLDKVAEILGIPKHKIRKNMANYANTSSATIPILLDEINRFGEINPHDIVLFASIGAGWTFGAAVYEWQ